MGFAGHWWPLMGEVSTDRRMRHQRLAPLPRPPPVRQRRLGGLQCSQTALNGRKLLAVSIQAAHTSQSFLPPVPAIRCWGESPP